MRTLGNYVIFLQSLFVNRQSFKTYYKRVIQECTLIGLGSIFIAILVSLSIGGVVSYQTAYNFRKNPIAIDFFIGAAIRSMVVSEIGPTITGLIFCGRIGASIASEIASMKVTEQIDALEVMGINSKSYLVLPKIIASVIMFPLLVIMSIILALLTGYLVCTKLIDVTHEDFVMGLRHNFEMYMVGVSIFKSAVFAFLISSIASYQGYNTYGGALEIGKTTTKAVANGCIALLIANYLVVKAFI